MQPSQKSLPRPASPVIETHAARETRITLDEAMDRYARGEEAAFDELFRQAGPRLRGFLLRMCGDPALAEDLTQEAILRVHLARGSFVPGSPALPWMLAIARNAFLDHTRREGVRRAAREHVSEANAALNHDGSSEARADEELVAREALELVRRTLERIPAIHREAFILLRFEGLSVHQAAQVLGASEAAVKVRAFRAYEALRSALHREGESPSQRR